MRVDAFFEILGCIWFGDSKKTIVETHFSVNRVSSAHPMDRAFDLAVRCRSASFAAQVSGAMQLDDVARRILHHLIALDDVGVFQTNFSAGPQTVVFRWRRFQKI